MSTKPWRVPTHSKSKGKESLNGTVKETIDTVHNATRRTIKKIIEKKGASFHL